MQADPALHANPLHLTALDSLADLLPGTPAQVLDVHAPDGQPEWAQQLHDLGFVAGEHVRVLTRGLPGGEPLVVRVGLSTYALRRAEAACVHIQLGGRAGGG